MERLTMRVDNGLEEIYFYNPDDPEGEYTLSDIAKNGHDDICDQIANRLAAYEDTGLTPAQVEAMKMDMEQLRADNINAEMNLAHMTADKDEQAGRIMKLEDGLKCLHDLLEEHVPNWYLRKHHKIAIDALLSPICNTTKLPCAECNPCCEHRGGE